MFDSSLRRRPNDQKMSRLQLSAFGCAKCNVFSACNSFSAYNASFCSIRADSSSQIQHFGTDIPRITGRQWLHRQSFFKKNEKMAIFPSTFWPWQTLCKYKEHFLWTRSVLTVSILGRVALGRRSRSTSGGIASRRVNTPGARGTPRNPPTSHGATGTVRILSPDRCQWAENGRIRNKAVVGRVFDKRVGDHSLRRPQTPHYLRIRHSVTNEHRFLCEQEPHTKSKKIFHLTCH